MDTKWLIKVYVFLCELHSEDHTTRSASKVEFLRFTAFVQLLFRHLPHFRNQPFLCLVFPLVFKMWNGIAVRSGNACGSPHKDRSSNLCVCESSIDQAIGFLFSSSSLVSCSFSPIWLFINTAEVNEMIGNLQTGSLHQILRQTLNTRLCLIRVCQWLATEPWPDHRNVAARTLWHQD